MSQDQDRNNSLSASTSTNTATTTTSSASPATPSLRSLQSHTAPSFVSTSTRDNQHSEASENPSDLATVTSRTRSTSRERKPGFFSRMSTNGTVASQDEQNHQQAHHGGFLDKVKSIYSNRPSSRDRHGGHAEDDSRSFRSGAETERGRQSRDGEQYISTGRGGAGNLRASSKSRPVEDPGEAEARARSRDRSGERGLVGGRGGAGNFRSTSKDPAARAREAEEERTAYVIEKAAVEKRHQEEAANPHFHSHGRGGAGNIGK